MEISLKTKTNTKTVLQAIAFGGVLALWSVGIGSPMAKPLDADECIKLQQDKLILVNKGIVERIEKGASEKPDAALLQDIGEYLKIEADLRFRCDVSRQKAVSSSGWPILVPLPVRNRLRVNAQDAKNNKAVENEPVLEAVIGQSGKKTKPQFRGNKVN